MFESVRTVSENLAFYFHQLKRKVGRDKRGNTVAQEQTDAATQKKDQTFSDDPKTTIISHIQAPNQANSTLNM